MKNIPAHAANSMCMATLVTIGLCFWSISSVATAKTCLFVASYHKGYEWQDGIEKGIESTLSDECKLHKFYMDTKRNQDEAFAEQKALEAKVTIEKLKPDVVLTSDDNVAKYLIEPYYKNANIPFVFSGVNWNGDKYGFPYKNATGMVEVISITPLLELIKSVLPNVKKGAFLTGNAASSISNHKRYKSEFDKENIEISGYYVDSMEQWKKAFLEIQSNMDFLITANKAGIKDWDDKIASEFILNNSKILSLGHHEFMTQHNMFSMTKIPAEQGEWAASVALEILKGTPASQFPVVANRKWNIYVNTTLLDTTQPKVSLPDAVMRRATKIQVEMTH